MRKLILLVVVFCFAASAGSSIAQDTVAQNSNDHDSKQPTLYIAADPNIQTALTAAMVKKHDNVSIVTDEAKADYTLKVSPVNSHTESGASILARCMFAYCIGVEGASSVSVQLIQKGTVLWAYQVRKANGGPSGIKPLSEAIAKHLQNDYLSKH